MSNIKQNTINKSEAPDSTIKIKKTIANILGVENLEPNDVGLTVYGQISASGLLYTSASHGDPSNLLLTWNSSSGQFHYTSSLAFGYIVLRLICFSVLFAKLYSRVSPAITFLMPVKNVLRVTLTPANEKQLNAN